MQEEFFDVAVVGGGHAACEAALASARTGAKTVMLAINLDHIAQMSCNPSIGGIAKGHVVREIDALGGAMGLVTDATCIQFRMLNMTKGPAVWSPRSQCDKQAYQRAMKRYLEMTPNLDIKQALVTEFIISGDTVCGVVTSHGDRFITKSVVVAAGTFLSGKLHYGLNSFQGGRAGDPASAELAKALKHQLSLRVGRLKTGTPPRILAPSVDFSVMEAQGPDDFEENFSHFPEDTVRPKVERRDMCCYMTHSTPETAEIVRRNIDKAPMYNGLIEGIGTRYCPSFEDKVIRFPHHERHHLYLEPEGEFTEEYYVNGISTSLPPEVQTQLVRSVPGMEKAKISRYAYAIEYDFVFPDELDRALSVRKWKGLYHAGQINGTSGYEEAAGQGLVAGLNAARHAAGLDHYEFGRDSSYLGVLVDDITTKEINEPYRLFTSRAEHRLHLRQDNSDFRLAEIGHSLGILPDYKYEIFKEYARKCADAEAACKAARISGKTLWDKLKDSKGIVDASNPPIPFDTMGLSPDSWQDRRAYRHVAARAHYEGYMKREDQAIAKLRELESWRIPESMDYSAIQGLRNESRMKLSKIKPSTLAQAGRIDGVTPPEIALLQVHISRIRRQNQKTEELS